MNRPLTMKKEGIQTRNRKISTKLKKAQKDQRLDSNFRFLDRSGLPWGGYGMPGGFHPGFPSMAPHHMGLPATSYASQMALPPPPMTHGASGALPHQGSFAPSPSGTTTGLSPFTGLPINPSTNPSTMAFGWLADDRTAATAAAASYINGQDATTLQPFTSRDMFWFWMFHVQNSCSIYYCAQL